MKRMITLLLALAMLAGPAQAEHLENYYYAVGNEAVSVQYFDGDYASVRIPAELENFPVTEISANAFANTELLAEVTIPESVTFIDEKAFGGRTDIRLVVVEGSAAEAFAVAHGMEYIAVECMPDFSVIPEGGVGPFSGESAVRKLQRLLVDVQLMAAEDADGFYNPATQSAVSGLQSLTGCEVTGIADEQTMLYLIWHPHGGSMAEGVTPYSAADSIRGMQEQLAALGLLEAVGGVYDLATVEAVQAFQREVNEKLQGQSIAVTGICDAQTKVYLGYMAGNVTPEPTEEVWTTPTFAALAVEVIPTVIPTLKPIVTQTIEPMATPNPIFPLTIESAKKYEGKIAAGDYHIVGLMSDGTVATAGYSEAGECDTKSWTDITMVEANLWATAGLMSDGMVVVAGDNTYGKCDTGNWNDVEAVAVGLAHTIGLMSDGTVVAIGHNGYGQCDTGSWTDIVAVGASNTHTVGLRSDGTVVAVGDNEYGECDTGNWTDIVAVEAGNCRTVGLRSDGTVVAVGDNRIGQCDTGSWKDVGAIAAGNWHTVGLKRDGTVVAVGYNGNGQCDTGNWRDIVAIAAGDGYTVGLMSDGSVVCTDPDYDLSSWDLF